MKSDHATVFPEGWAIIKENKDNYRMAELFDISSYPLNVTLSTLLKDQTTGENIIFATDAYDDKEPTDHITKEMFAGNNPIVIQPRSFKSLQEQQKRTRHMAEVFTPTWLCNRMNNHIDEQWFGYKDVFNKELPDNQWEASDGIVVFPEGKSWLEYLNSKRLEITCGEAPYLVSRYDTTTGDSVLPLSRRIGILDRKLRIVNEHTKTEKTWTKRAMEAIQSCYGFEFQGDSLLIARINILLSFCEYHTSRWGELPSEEAIAFAAEIVSWNLWQMDGFTDAPPLGKPEEMHKQLDLFDFDESEEDVVPLCRIMDWAKDKTLVYKAIKEGI